MDFDHSVLVACAGIRHAAVAATNERLSGPGLAEKLREALIVGCVKDGLTQELVADLFNVHTTTIDEFVKEADSKIG